MMQQLPPEKRAEMRKIMKTSTAEMGEMKGATDYASNQLEQSWRDAEELRYMKHVLISRAPPAPPLHKQKKEKTSKKTKKRKVKKNLEKWRQEEEEEEEEEEDEEDEKEEL